MQTLTGGLVLGAMAAATGELSGFEVRSVFACSWMAFVYLIVVGALIGYSAYIWLPGWALADESLTFRSVAAATIILGLVVVITFEGGLRRTQASNPVPQREVR